MTFTLRRSLPLLFALAASAANGQWTAIRLHPSSVNGSTLLCSTRLRQAGWVRIGNEYRASLWSGSSSSWVSLHPAGAADSYVFGIGGTTQVGSVSVGAAPAHAALWNGSAQSYVDLHPAGATSSVARAVSGTMQVGSAIYPVTGEVACTWSGTAGSVVTFPVAGSSSTINACDSVQQVGQYNIGNQSNARKACVWTGSADSFVSLHPAGAYLSEAYGVDGGHQVGLYYSSTPGMAPRAAIWSGTVSSMIDINPPGASSSCAYAISGQKVAGMAYLDAGMSVQHPFVWEGFGSTATDLAQFLPPAFGGSTEQLSGEATGIWQEGPVTYVCGWATNRSTNQQEAILWRFPAIPTSMTGIIGLNDVVWNPGYPRSITVQVKQGAVTLATRTINVGTTAALSMNVPGAGSAVVTIDGPTQLIRRRNVFLDGNPIDLGSVVLNNGDCDGSGEVDAVDIDFVIAEFGQTFSLGDVDLSGEVDAVDIDIVIACFGNVDE